jgi:protein-disulfide isomerase
MSNWKMVLVAVLGALILVGIMVWGLTKMGEDQSGLDVEVEKLTDGSGWVTNEENYKLTVVEFSDLQCPACKQAESSVAENLRQMDGVRYVFRHFPLLTIHKNAWRAARAMETAKKMDKGWGMMELLFEKQEEWSESNDLDKRAVGYAKELGLNESEFETIYNEGDVDEQIVRDSALAKELSLGGTPTFFVEGEPVATNFVLTKVEEILKSK